MEQSLFEQQLPQWCAARHGTGGSDYLVGCTTSQPTGHDTSLPGVFLGWLPSMLVSEEVRRMVANERTNWSGPRLRPPPRLPLSIVTWRLGPLIERWNINPPQITWWRMCTNPSMDTNWYWLFAQLFFSVFTSGREGVTEMDYYAAIMVLLFFFLSVLAAEFF